MRRRNIISAIAIAVVFAVVTAGVAGASENGQPAGAHGHVHSKPVCRAQADHAQCSAVVVTDADGNPIVSDRPMASGTNGYTYGLSPASFHAAYSLPWYTNVRQTIAVVDAYDHPTVKADLDYFDSAWGLGSFPSCSSTVTAGCFQRVDENGYVQGFRNSSASGAQQWELETALDVQTAHGICLNCKLLLVEAFTDSRADLATAVNTAARLGATEISNSYGWLESSVSDWYPSAYNHAGIAITASAHDHGYGAYYPADLNTVVAVGGTRLDVNSDGSYNSESVWGNGTNAPSGWGTGSGCSSFSSSYTSAAYWQKTVANWSYTGCGSQRAIADVAADADPSTGAWVYASTPVDSRGDTGWFVEGGTSLSAPIVAGVFALAGNAASTSWPALFMYQHQNQFHDVRSGTNGKCTYTIMCNGWSGYDGPTGLGTPWGLGGF
jgi:subtilase family serine protease